MTKIILTTQTPANLADTDRVAVTMDAATLATITGYPVKGLKEGHYFDVQPLLTWIDEFGDEAENERRAQDLEAAAASTRTIPGRNPNGSVPGNQRNGSP